ncbi:MAG: carbohydrate-binding family 9-like protein [Oscillospiraceae bacterium]
MNSYIISHQERPDWSALPKAELRHAGWLPPAPVSAWAQACHNGAELLVRMEAVESPIRATLTGPLEQVCNDSCLEFFFAPDPGDGRYFNFEFNPLGTLYLGFGAARPHRIRQVPKDAVGLFRPEPFTTESGWGVSFRIPLAFLRLYFPNFSFQGEAAGNFYKCGDETVLPHYLSWNPMTAERPDFHRRQDFGTLLFR